VRPRRLVLRLVAVAVALTVGGVTAYELTRAHEFGYRLATARAENASGGYAISYPPAWDLSRSGTATSLVSPDGSVVVSVGRGPKGSAKQAAEGLVMEIRKTYRGTRVLGSQPQRIGGAPALAISGTGRNEAGVGIRFVAIAVQGPDAATFTITAFTLLNADAHRVVPVLSEIVDSFRPL
jgi:hypothetical protein